MMTNASIDIMQDSLGFSYNTLFATFKNDYINLYYPIKDLKMHSEIILKKLPENPDYLAEKRKQYNSQVAVFEKDFKTARETVSSLSDRELFALLLRIGKACEATVGTAHLIESISLSLGDVIRERLSVKSSGKELNEDLSILSAPITQSYLSKKEEALWHIKNAKGPEKARLAKIFISGFHWIRTNVVCSQPVTLQMVLEEAKRLKSSQKPDFESLKKQKHKLFIKYGFSGEEKKMVFWTEFVIDWQDERKANIYRGIFYLDQVLKEISKRYRVQPKLLHYLLPHEITPESIKNGTARKIAKNRIKGSVFIKKPGEMSVFDGAEFFEFEKTINKKAKEVEVLNGISASLGTAIGPVKICTTIASLKKVKQGDIMVASMTRPDYLPAMKKAAAIVTDEGGITCHAAIVSRELGIPCVIATKNATKVLKDGWIVSVKANHGQVLVLEKGGKNTEKR